MVGSSVGYSEVFNYVKLNGTLVGNIMGVESRLYLTVKSWSGYRFFPSELFLTRKFVSVITHWDKKKNESLS